jgi:hypothetical protein
MLPHLPGKDSPFICDYCNYNPADIHHSATDKVQEFNKKVEFLQSKLQAEEIMSGVTVNLNVNLNVNNNNALHLIIVGRTQIPLAQLVTLSYGVPMQVNCKAPSMSTTDDTHDTPSLWSSMLKILHEQKQQFIVQSVETNDILVRHWAVIPIGKESGSALMLVSDACCSLLKM